MIQEFEARASIEERQREVQQVIEEGFLSRLLEQGASDEVEDPERRMFLRLAGLSIVSLVAAACTPAVTRGAGGHETKLPMVTKGGDVVPQNTATAGPEPTVTPTSEPVVKEQPCAIMEPKQCAQAELIDWTYQGQKYKLVGFRDLPTGTPVRSPIDGQVGKTQANEPFTGFFASVRNLSDPASPNFTFIGDLAFDNMLSVNVRRGDVIGHVQNTGVKNFGGYSLIFRVTQRDPSSGKFATPENILKELFPVLGSRPIAQSITQEGQIKPVVVDRYK